MEKYVIPRRPEAVSRPGLPNTLQGWLTAALLVSLITLMWNLMFHYSGLVADISEAKNDTEHIKRWACLKAKTQRGKVALGCGDS